jgi:thiol:disulfide interchange protein DsbD
MNLRWLWLGLFAFAAVAGAEEELQLRADLVAEHVALKAGATQTLGLRLRHEPHWHSYWINPGDSGLPTTLTWSVPAGWSVDEIAWPAPTRFEVDGLYNFGYEGELVLPLTITVPADAAGTVRLEALAKWLACREICVPGRATLSLELPIAASAPAVDARRATLFARARASLPQSASWQGEARVVGERIEVELHGTDLPDAAGLDAFIEQRRVADHRVPVIRRDGDVLLVGFGRSDYFGTPPASIGLVLTQASTQRAWRIEVPLAATAAP